MKIPAPLMKHFYQSGSQKDLTQVTRILTSESNYEILISGSYAFKAKQIDSIDRLINEIMEVNVTSTNFLRITT